MYHFTKSILLFFLLFSTSVVGYSQADISGQVFEDTNGDGVNNDGATGPSVAVNLYTSANVFVATVNSDGFTGAYIFPSVAAGDYYLVFGTTGSYVLTTMGLAADESDPDPSNGQTPTFTLTNGNNITDIDAGYYVPVEVNGVVFLDNNGNGQDDDGMSMPVGVDVLLTSVSTGTMYGPQNTTNNYSFTNLPPDEYFVTFESTPGGNHVLTFQTIGAAASDSDPDIASGLTGNFTANSGDMVIDLDAGYYVPITIGDFVWEDVNGNGIQDGGEPGLDGINVSLSGMDGTGGAVNLGPIATSGGGMYMFTDLAPGMYTITFGALPANNFFTYMALGGNPDDDSDADMITGVAPDVVVVSGDVIDDIDAGVYIGAEISDFVWEDLNGDGIQDAGEPGLDGIVVSLSGIDGAGNPVNLGPINTAGGGMYLFDELAPGMYTITFGALPANHFFTYMGLGGNNTTDSDADMTSGVAPSVTVESGDIIDDVDAGVYVGAEISNFVWEDLNGDGIQDAGEPGLDGIDITLTGIDGSGMAVGPIVVTSAGGGAYIFDMLAPGDYELTFAANLTGPNYYRTLQDQGGDDTADSDANQTTGLTATVTLISADTNMDMDAGYYRAGEIGDFTWIDLDGDGIQNDPGSLGGVTITLTDDLGNPVTDVNGNPIAAITSGGAGDYVFPDLKPGLYKLTFAAPAGFFPTRLDAAGGPDDLTDADNDSDLDQGNANMTFDIEIESGEVEEGIDAGFYEPVTIGDFVWHDANADGIQDAGEIGEPGVTVTLENADGSPLTDVNGNPIAPEVTDAAGMYEFMDVRPGEYNVVVTAPAMWFFSDPDVTGDDADSDFDMTGNLVTTLQVNSGDPAVTNIDAGIYKNIEIIGTVWIEGDNNGMFDMATEGGALGVEVTITTDPGGVLTATSVTNANGEYMFSVKPGDYIIAVTDANFGSGNPLNGVESCGPTEDPNNDVDLDDNGDGPAAGPVITSVINFRCGEEPDPDGVTNETIDFCFTFNCGAENSLSAPSCEMVVDTFCNLTILDAGCATMPPGPLVGPAPNPLCDGMGAPHNMSWFAFIAGTGDYEIEIVPYGCLPGDGGQLGMQAGIYEDCSFSNSIFCMAGCTTNNINIPSSNFVPGNTYYFWFDGCAGSVCSYEINVNGTFEEYIIPEPTEIVCASSVCTPVCPDTDITLQVNDGYDNATLKFVWQVTSPSGITSIENTLENTLDYTVTEIGTYTFEIISVGNKCNRTATIQSYDVVVRHPDAEDFGLVELCENYVMGWAGPGADQTGNSDPNGDGTPGWQVSPYTFVEGTNTGTVMQDGCIYDQTVTLQTLYNSAPAPLTLTLCPDEIPYSIGGIFPYEILGPVPPTEVVIEGRAANGCDTIINLEVIVLQTNFGEIYTDGICVDGSTRYELTGVVIPDPPVVSIVRWRNTDTGMLVDDLDPDGDPRTILIDEDGNYTCEVVMTLNGVECISEFPFIVSTSGIPAPTASGPLAICSSTTQSTYTAVSGDPTDEFEWEVPFGVTFVGQGTNTITVDWNGQPGGDICVSVVGDCGNSPQFCQTVVITPSPAVDFMVEPMICVDSTASTVFTLPAATGTTYNWGLDGGSIIAGPSSNGNDSLEVSWTDPGKKYITLSITRNGCASLVTIDSVEVIDLLDPPVIQCTANATEITFFWDPVPGQTSSTVTVTTGQSGLKFNNSYIVSGLLPGASVDIEVLLATTHACGDIVIDGSCVTQNCTPEAVTLDMVPNICLTPTSPLVDLRAIANTVSTDGTYVFSGPGVDPASETFDPNLAGVGAHQIRLVYTNTVPCISAAAFTTINVFATPNALFTAESVICQDSLAIIDYTGSIQTGGTFNWDFGPDVILPGTGPGPFSVGWNTPGVKNVTLTTSRNGCTSTPVQQMVTVEPRIEPILITCPTLGATVLTFDWNDVANTSEYIVTLNGVAQPNPTQSMLMLNGLITDTDYTLTVEAISSNSCPGVQNTLVCRTNDCPPVSAMFSIPDSTICFQAGLPTIDITATIIGGLQSVNQMITWSGNGLTSTSGLTTTFDPNIAGVGVHNIMLDLVDGTCTYDTMMTIEIIAKPLSTISGPALVCIDDDYIIDFTGTPNLEKNWTLPTGVTISGVGQPTGKFKVTFPSDGDYTIGLVVGTGDCVSDLSSIDVKVDPALPAITITCQSTTTSVTFNWTDGGDCVDDYAVAINTVSQANQSTLSYLADNLIVGEMVEITVTPISLCACPATPVSRVCEAKDCPPITLTLSSPITAYCAGSNNTPFQLIANAAGSSGTGMGTWTGTNVTPSGMFNPAGLAPNTYVITYDFNEESCDYSSTISIEVYDLPTLTVTSVSPDCYSDNVGSATITTVGGTAPYEVKVNDAVTTPPLNNVAPGTYTVAVSDANQCTDTGAFTISAALQPSISLTGISTIQKGQSTDLTATITGLAASIDSIVWVDNAGIVVCSGPTCTTLNVSPQASQRYCATVYYNNGCNVEDCISITVQELPVIIEIVFPNVISVDGSNASFFVPAYDQIVLVKSMQIFDRWGNLVFTKENVPAGDPSQGWNGKFKDSDMVPGVYVYKIDVETIDGKTQNFAGDVTVL